MTHTPGPWRVIVNCNNYEEYPYLVYAGSMHVASIPQENHGDHEINASLIAAAPETAAERDRLKKVKAELLAALRVAAEGLNSITDNAGEWSIDAIRSHAQDLRVLIDAAIAKAEGR